jgi:hypothetical protein
LAPDRFRAPDQVIGQAPNLAGAFFGDAVSALASFVEVHLRLEFCIADDAGCSLLGGFDDQLDAFRRPGGRPPQRSPATLIRTCRLVIHR